MGFAAKDRYRDKATDESLPLIHVPASVSRQVGRSFVAIPSKTMLAVTRRQMKFRASPFESATDSRPPPPFILMTQARRSGDKVPDSGNFGRQIDNGQAL